MGLVEAVTVATAASPPVTVYSVPSVHTVSPPDDETKITRKSDEFQITKSVANSVVEPSPLKRVKRVVEFKVIGTSHFDYYKRAFFDCGDKQDKCDVSNRLLF